MTPSRPTCKTFVLAVLVLSATFGLVPAQTTVKTLTVATEWDFLALYGETGHVGLRAFHDVDGDGEKEFIANIGSALDFVALEMDGTEVWRTTIDTTSSKLAYYAKTIESENILIYGSRLTDTLYGLNLDDGTLRWSHKVSGDLNAVESSMLGAVFGTSSQVGILDYTTGQMLPNWPISYAQHEQILSAGDLTGDGMDEIVLNNNSGNIQVRNSDGSLRFEINSLHTHVDLATIADIDPTHPGNELLTCIDDNNNTSGEGDEFALFSADGTLLHKYEAPYAGANPAVADILPDVPGLEIAFGLEDNGNVGLLTGTLEEVFLKRIPGINGGQIAVADLYGDDRLEILANTGEYASAGFKVIDTEGNVLATRLGQGWDFDPSANNSNAAAGTKQFVDVTGDGVPDIHASRVGANSRDGHEIIYLHTVSTISIPPGTDVADPVEDIGDYSYTSTAGVTRPDGDQGLEPEVGDHFISLSTSATSPQSGSIAFRNGFGTDQLLQPGTYTLRMLVGDGDIGREGFTTFDAHLQTLGGEDLADPEVLQSYIDPGLPGTASWQEIAVRYAIGPGDPLIGNEYTWAADWTKTGTTRGFYGAMDGLTVEFIPLLEGDLNGDGMVGSADLDIVRSAWGTSVEPGAAADPSGDGTVDSADLDIVRANWGRTAETAAVPEPGATILLMALIGLGFCFRPSLR